MPRGKGKTKRSKKGKTNRKTKASGAKKVLFSPGVAASTSGSLGSRPDAPYWMQSKISNKQLSAQIQKIDKGIAEHLKSSLKDYIVPRGTLPVTGPFGHHVSSVIDGADHYMRDYAHASIDPRTFIMPNPTVEGTDPNLFRAFLEKNKSQIRAVKYDPSKNGGRLPGMMVADHGAGEPYMTHVFNLRSHMKNAKKEAEKRNDLTFKGVFGHKGPEEDNNNSGNDNNNGNDINPLVSVLEKYSRSKIFGDNSVDDLIERLDDPNYKLTEDNFSILRNVRDSGILGNNQNEYISVARALFGHDQPSPPNLPPRPEIQSRAFLYPQQNPPQKPPRPGRTYDGSEEDDNDKLNTALERIDSQSSGDYYTTADFTTME